MLLLWALMSLLLGLTFLLSISPHFLAIILILLSSTLVLLLATFQLWYSFILLLIFAGGLMILILYTITMTFTNISAKPYRLHLAYLSTFLTLAVLMKTILMHNSSLHFMFNTLPYSLQSMNPLLLTSTSSSPSYLLTIFYLLMVLLLLLSMLKKEKTSIRLFKL